MIDNRLIIVQHQPVIPPQPETQVLVGVNLLPAIPTRAAQLARPTLPERGEGTSRADTVLAWRHLDELGVDALEDGP